MVALEAMNFVYSVYYITLQTRARDKAVQLIDAIEQAWRHSEGRVISLWKNGKRFVCI